MKISRFSAIAILGVGVGAVGPTNGARADSEIRELREMQREFEGQIEEKRERITALNTVIREIEAGRVQDDDSRFPEFAGPCDIQCRPGSSGCTEDIFRTILGVPAGTAVDLNTAVISRGQEPCVIIWEATRPNLTGVAPACASAVRGCGVVARTLRIASIRRDISTLETEIESITREKRDLARDITDATRACPQCAMMEAMRPREPGIGDYIVGGLQAITPMVLGGISAYSYASGLDRYYGAYQSYLGQCLAIGVPCGPPGAGGMGGGMGGYGMGMGGYGMGMGGMAMGMGGMALGM